MKTRIVKLQSGTAITQKPVTSYLEYLNCFNKIKSEVNPIKISEGKYRSFRTSTLFEWSLDYNWKNFISKFNTIKRELTNDSNPLIVQVFNKELLQTDINELVSSLEDIPEEMSLLQENESKGIAFGYWPFEKDQEFYKAFPSELYDEIIDKKLIINKVIVNSHNALKIKVYLPVKVNNYQDTLHLMQESDSRLKKFFSQTRAIREIKDYYIDPSISSPYADYSEFVDVYRETILNGPTPFADEYFSLVTITTNRDYFEVQSQDDIHYFRKDSLGKINPEKSGSLRIPDASFSSAIIFDRIVPNQHAELIEVKPIPVYKKVRILTIDEYGALAAFPSAKQSIDPLMKWSDDYTFKIYEKWRFFIQKFDGEISKEKPAYCYSIRYDEGPSEDINTNTLQARDPLDVLEILSIKFNEHNKLNKVISKIKDSRAYNDWRNKIDFVNGTLNSANITREIAAETERDINEKAEAVKELYSRVASSIPSDLEDLRLTNNPDFQIDALKLKLSSSNVILDKLQGHFQSNKDKIDNIMQSLAAAKPSDVNSISTQLADSMRILQEFEVTIEHPDQDVEITLLESWKEIAPKKAQFDGDSLAGSLFWVNQLKQNLESYSNELADAIESATIAEEAVKPISIPTKLVSFIEWIEQIPEHLSKLSKSLFSYLLKMLAALAASVVTALAVVSATYDMLMKLRVPVSFKKWESISDIIPDSNGRYPLGFILPKGVCLRDSFISKVNSTHISESSAIKNARLERAYINVPGLSSSAGYILSLDSDALTNYFPFYKSVINSNLYDFEKLHALLIFEEARLNVQLTPHERGIATGLVLLQIGVAVASAVASAKSIFGKIFAAIAAAVIVSVANAVDGALWETKHSGFSTNYNDVFGSPKDAFAYESLVRRNSQYHWLLPLSNILVIPSTWLASLISVLPNVLRIGGAIVGSALIASQLGKAGDKIRAKSAIRKKRKEYKQNKNNIVTTTIKNKDGTLSVKTTKLTRRELDEKIKFDTFINDNQSVSINSLNDNALMNGSEKISDNVNRFAEDMAVSSSSIISMQKNIEDLQNQIENLENTTNVMKEDIKNLNQDQQELEDAVFFVRAKFN